MKILIIENVWMGGRKYSLFDKTLLTMFTILPTLNARHIAAITPKKHEVKVINERYEKINFEEKWDLVNINFTTSTAPHAYDIADKFRKKDIIVVLSGLHPSLMPDEAKQHADSVLLGVGELNWLTLLEDYENKMLKTYYQPVKYGKNTILPPTNINLPGVILSGAIEATRGCPYKCEFCRESHIPGGSQFYTRPVDEVIDEIKNLPQKSFTFYDTSLTIDTNYTKELFEKMIGLKKRFSCNGNVDVLANDKELVSLSKKAGCVSWLIGFESINQETLYDIGKKTNIVKEYKQAVQNIHKNGMVVIGCFVFGFDKDYKNIFNNTLKIIQELEIDAADFFVLTPFPGTPLYNKMQKEKRIITYDWHFYNMKTVVFKPKNMTREELLFGVKNMYKKYYSTPLSIIRIIKSLKYGFFPFILVLERNFSTHMNIRVLFKTKSN